MEDSNKSSGFDLLGIKPIADAANTTVEKTFEGIEGFLQAVCVPALNEVGFLFRDKVRHWRLKNILSILDKAKDKLEFDGENLQISAHPRVALSIIENGSLCDDNTVQEMWAGLFASSCTASGQNDENLIFVDLLKQLTNAEARILRYTCENSKKIIFENGLIGADELEFDFASLVKISEVSEIHRLDRELDHLRSLELLNGGFNPDGKKPIAQIAPTSLALNLYVKSNGFNQDPVSFWKNNIMSEADWEAHKHKEKMKKNEESE